MADLVKNEVNVKDIKIVDNEESGLVKRVKADFKKLGPRYGKIMKDLGKAIIAMSQKEIAVLEKEGRFAFEALPGVPVVTTEDVEIIPEDVPGWLVANDGSITVALDVTITPEPQKRGNGSRACQPHTEHPQIAGFRDYGQGGGNAFPGG